MTGPSHAISWFEIPVTDFPRAKRFYEAVLGHAIEELEMGDTTMGMFSTDSAVIGGAIVRGDGLVPSQQGTTVYLNGGADLAVLLARVEGAGGSIAIPKTEIGGNFGFFAHFIDTEGNRIGLHSMQ